MKKKPVPSSATFMRVLGTVALYSAKAVGAAGIGIYRGAQWYGRRPASIDSLVQLTKKHTSAANFPSPKDFVTGHLERFLTACSGTYPAESVYETWGRVASTLYKQEALGQAPQPIPAWNAVQEGQYRDRLTIHLHKSANAEATLQLFDDTLQQMARDFMATLPELARTNREQFFGESTPSLTTLRLIDVLPDVAASVHALIAPILTTKTLREAHLFDPIRDQIAVNFDTISDKKLVAPADFKGTKHELVEAYLADTPLRDLFYQPIAFDVPDSKMLEHCLIVAGSGWGKTQLIEKMVWDFISRDDPPSLVIMDSQGDVLKRIQRLAVFHPEHGRLKDRITIIDPTVDTPSLNMFDISNPRMGSYGEQEKEKVEAEVMALFSYVFAALDTELTRRMGTAFLHLVRLMMAIPEGDLRVLHWLVDGEPNTVAYVKDFLKTQDKNTQLFFDNHFFQPRYAALKASLSDRLNAILSVPTFVRMFRGANTLDMYKATQEEGRIVLINTARDLLQDAFQIFGRYMIARVLASAAERAAIPLEKRRPTFLIVDEASDYLDENTDRILKQARKLRLGLVLAFQNMGQMDKARLLQSALGNTSVKYVGDVPGNEQRLMANNMGTTSPDLFKTLRLTEGKETQFVCYVRASGTGVKINIPFFVLDKQSQLTPEAHAELLRRNRARVSAAQRQPSPPEPKPEPQKPRTVPTPEATKASVTAIPSSDDWEE